MKYTKAFAEVVVLNNTDIVTASITPNTPVADIIDQLSDEELRNLLGSVYIENDIANAIRNLIVGDAVENAALRHMTVEQAQKYIKEVHESCNGLFTAASRLYSSEEEDDSFDSEW